MFSLRIALISLALLACMAVAESVVFSLVSDDPSMEDHWPSADALIGTADDHISASCSPVNCSGTNAAGSYSFNAFDFGGGGSDTGIPAGYQAITFLEGGVGIDMTVAASGGGPLFTSLTVSGTEPFNGHGAYSSFLAAINSGSYDPVSHAFTLNVDLTAEFGGPPDTALNFISTGVAWVIDASEFGTTTGDAYLDDVAIPRALAQSASGLVFIRLTGVVPHAENWSWGAMPLTATILAFTDAVATTESNWGELKSRY
jgi:hypothetical protein